MFCFFRAEVALCWHKPTREGSGRPPGYFPVLRGPKRSFNKDLGRCFQAVGQKPGRGEDGKGCHPGRERI
jgi:hypothetical protein